MENSSKQIHWYPGHMAKTIRKVKEILPLIDVVIELRDARIPISSCNPAIDELIKNKYRLILLNKSDLADEKYTNEWIKYYNTLGIECLCIDSISKFNFDKIITNTKKTISKKLEKEKSNGLKERSIRALIVGIPNVGKSTFINSISKRKSTKTGNRAGVTKALQWINIEGLSLLDSPGLLYPKITDSVVAFHLAITNSIKLDILPKDDISVYIIDFMIKYYKSSFFNRYKLEDIDLNDINYITNIYDLIGRNRGCLIKGNKIDYDKVTDIIITDFKQSKFGRITIDRFEHFDVT